MLVGMLGVLVGLLAVLVSCYSVLLGLFVFALFVMVDSLSVMMGRRLVMPSRVVMVLARRMFHRHGSAPFNGTVVRRILQQNLENTRGLSQGIALLGTPSQNSELHVSNRLR
jgi:hypothetical protein